MTCLWLNVRCESVDFHCPGSRPLLPPRKGGDWRGGAAALNSWFRTASLLRTPEMSSWVDWGEFCKGPVSGRVKACCGMRNASDEKATSLLPASPTSIHLGRWVPWFPCHDGNPLPTPHAHSRGWSRRGLCWTKATEFKNLERVPHNRRSCRISKPFWFQTHRNSVTGKVSCCF